MRGRWRPTRRSRRRNLALSIARGAAAGPIRGSTIRVRFPFSASAPRYSPTLLTIPLFLFSQPKFDLPMHRSSSPRRPRSRTRKRARIIHRILALKRENGTFPAGSRVARIQLSDTPVHSRHRFSSLTATAPTNWVDFGALGVSVPCCSLGCLYIVECFVANSVDNITRNSRESLQNQANQVVISLFNDCLETSLGICFQSSWTVVHKVNRYASLA